MHPIINDYLEKGFIEKEAAARLNDFEGLIKEAGFLDMLKKVWNTIRKPVGTALKTTVGPVVGSIAGVQLAKYLNDQEYTKQQNETNAQLQHSFQVMKTIHPEFQKKDPIKLQQRFNEIAHISPTLAGTPTIAAKVLKRTFNKGLDEIDMRKMYQLEDHAQRLKALPGPQTTMGDLAMDLGPTLGRELISPIVSNTVNNASIFKPPYEGFNTQVASGKKLVQAFTTIKQISEYVQNRERFDARRLAANEEGILPDKLEENGKVTGRMMNSLFPEAVEREKQIMSMSKKASVLANAHILVKEAGTLPPGFLKGIMTAAAFGLGSAGVHFAADRIISKRRQEDVLNSWDQTSKSLKNMTETGHGSAEGVDFLNKETMDAAKSTFQTLVTVAPDLATNPTIATAYVAKVLRAGELDVAAIKTVSEIQKNMEAVGGYKSPFAKSPVVQGFESGFQSAGGKEYMGAFAKDQVKPEYLKRKEKVMARADEVKAKSYLKSLDKGKEKVDG